MRYPVVRALLAGAVVILAEIAISQQLPNGAQPASQSTTPDQRAAATRTFLGLGPEPDKVAAARGAPLYQQNCAFCHGPQARGATGASLITSDEVLKDDHGEHLAEFLKMGRPEKGMPAFATMPEDQLKDIAEFVHVQVEEVANRGAYHVLNILVGNEERGREYVSSHCVSCHAPGAFAHIGSRFRLPEQLQRGWIWPIRSTNESLALTATVKTPEGATLTGRVTQISDFRITLIDHTGQTHIVDRTPGVQVEMQDPLAAHHQIIQSLTNEDMHNVTAYLETLQ
ncbi:c-type cytochrome [Acidicapsa acidisoli]|uniref:c-type cytochrome n=1 Tax=Acidicapsa acidisoli TaxID=1615681 RepID=UPI0021DFB0AA|nr:cytochrome c [Acidicapsa acidisoli]